MIKKIAGYLFVFSFALTGCGIESIFNGGITEWCFCFLVAAACAAVLFGGDK